MAIRRRLVERFLANEKHWEDRTQDRILNITYSDDAINNTFFSAYTELSAEDKQKYKQEILERVKKLVMNYRVKVLAGHDKKRVTAVEFALVQIINSKGERINPIFVDAEDNMRGNRWVATSNRDRVHTLMLFPATTSTSSILRQIINHYNRIFLGAEESAVDSHEADYEKVPGAVITIDVDDIVNPKEIIKTVPKASELPYKVLADYIKDSKGRPKKITFLDGKKTFASLPVVDSYMGKGDTTGIWGWVVIKPKTAQELKLFREYLDKHPQYLPYEKIIEKVNVGGKEVSITTAFKIFNLFTQTAFNNGKLLKEDFIKGGLADNLTLQEIVIHHVLSGPNVEASSQIEKYDELWPIAVEQLKKGIKVELEHTNDPSLAEEIALDHLYENITYYDELSKIEGNTTNEAYASKAQARFFHAKAAEGGKEGKKWKKWASEWDKETPDFEDLPEKK